MISKLGGCSTRFERATAGTTIQSSNQLSYEHHVSPAELESAIYCLEGSCSIQLSYGDSLLTITKIDY